MGMYSKGCLLGTISMEYIRFILFISIKINTKSTNSGEKYDMKTNTIGKSSVPLCRRKRTLMENYSELSKLQTSVGDHMPTISSFIDPKMYHSNARS